MNTKVMGTCLALFLPWWNGTATASMVHEKGHTSERVIWALLLPHSNVRMDASEVVIQARALFVIGKVVN